MPFIRIEQAKQILNRIHDDLETIAKSEDEFIGDFSNEENRADNQYLKQIASHLSDAVRLYDYMKRPVIVEGFVSKRDDGRYEFEGTDIYLTSGTPIEYFDDYYNCFINSRIEYKNEDYVVVDEPNQPLSELRLRYR